MLNGGCGEGLVLSGLYGGIPLYVRGCGVRLKFLTLAAKPGPVARAARPLVPSLLAVLVANSAAAARLVVVVLRTPPEGQAAPL